MYCFLVQYDDGSEGSTYVRDMVHASPEQLELRQNGKIQVSLKNHKNYEF